jgi:hypothetical protein
MPGYRVAMHSDPQRRPAVEASYNLLLKLINGEKKPEASIDLAKLRAIA